LALNDAIKQSRVDSRENLTEALKALGLVDS
jgi:hypothetical protein